MENLSKTFLMFTLVVISSVFGFGQESGDPGRFGFTINSSLNGEVYPLRLVPSATYLTGNNMFELGVGFNPGIRKDQKILSGELNYKYFPNGMENKFNMFLIAQLSYLNNQRATFYPTTLNYIFLNSGYGFHITPFKGAYMGTNISIGSFTYSKNSENPYQSQFTSNSFFDEIGFTLAMQFNIGYTF